MQVERYLKTYQPVIYQTFLNSLQKDQLSHAYLIAGNNGAPLLDVATFFAKSILCDDPSPLACNSCITCLRVDDGNYPDFFVFDGSKTTIKKEAVTTIESAFEKKAFENNIVRKLPDDAEISFKQSGDQLVVSSGRAVFHLPTLPAENFPAMAGGNLNTKFQMTTDDLAHLINQTKFAIPTDDVRYHLGGIFFHISEDTGKLTAVATDAQRMALCAMTAPKGSEGMPSVILPRRVIGELSKLLEDANVDDVLIELSDTKARFTVGASTNLLVNVAA